MAIYSLRVQPIMRSEGRSMLAAAAYRSATELADARLGMTFDYAAKSAGVEHTAIIAPANAPPEYQDRATLWNAAEAADKRRDAVPAREILVALPHELTADQRKNLVEAFARESLARRGMVADVALHLPDREGDGRNHHAHILVTTRDLSEAGFGKKNRDWHAPEFVKDVRREWAEVQNRYLERYAPDVPRVSEKTLAEQGIDREPTQHQGPEVTAMERRDERTERGENNRDIAAQNRGQEAQDKALDRQVADAWKAQKWVERPTSDVAKEMDSTRAAMAHQRDIWKGERAQIQSPKPPSARSLEAELTRDEARKLRRAKAKEEAHKERARQSGVSPKQLAQWYTNPGQAYLRAITRWNKELDALADGRRERERAEAVLQARRAWVKSPAGQAEVANRRQPATDAAKAAKTQQRTLDRKIARMGKRIEEADRAILRTKVVQRLGHETLRVPEQTPSASGRGLANARRYFRFMSAEATATYKKAPEPEVREALKFIRSQPPGAPIPSARGGAQPIIPTPAPTPKGPSLAD
ncbi:MAG: MobQ family relaxase [Caulobacteraceae bacterium]